MPISYEETCLTKQEMSMFPQSWGGGHTWTFLYSPRALQWLNVARVETGTMLTVSLYHYPFDVRAQMTLIFGADNYVIFHHA